MQHYFRIGEISKLYGIGPDALRYYEDLGIMVPVRATNGYRMYTVNDIWRLNVIRDLRELGLGMEQIGAYLENRSIDSSISLLENEHTVISQKIETLLRLQENVEQRLGIFRQAKRKEVGVVQQITCPARHCHQIHEGYCTDEEMDVLIKRLLNINTEKLYVVGNNQIGSKISLESAKRGEVRNYDAVFIIDEDAPTLIPAGNYLSVSYRGDCAQNKRYVPALLAYAREQHLDIEGPILELLWVDIHASSDLSEHITELQIRIK